MTLVLSPVRSLLTAVLALVVLPAALVALVAPPVHAADNGAWSVTPTPADVDNPAPRNYFVLEGDPGATLKDSLRVRNYTDKPITFTLYGADAYNTRQGGFFALNNVDQPQVDAGSWVRLPITTLKVAPRTQADVPFTIKIPDNATPGDHVGGLVAMNARIEGTQDAGGVDVGVQRAVGARMYLRVSGPTTPGLAVADVTLDTDRGVLPWSGSGKGTISYTVENTGNLRLSPTSVVELSGLGGQIDEVTDTSLGDLLPGQKATMTARVEGVPWAGRLVTTVTATSPEGASAQESTTTWLVPWLGMLGIALLVALAAWYLLRRRSRIRRSLAKAESAPRIDVPALR